MMTLWHKNSTESVLLQREQAERKLNSGEVKINALFSAISHGTERLVCSGRVNNESCIDKMQVPFMEGDFNLPCSYGYSLVGEIVESHGPLQAGSLVHIMHPHQNQIVVQANNVTPLPEQIDPPRATLISNLETVINAIWDSNIQLGDTVAVMGFGGLGALLASLLQSWHFGALTVVEANEDRRKIADDLGFDVRTEREISPSNIIFNTTGNPAALNDAIQNLTLDGRLIEMSWYGDSPVTLNLGDAFHYKRIRLISSQVSVIPAHKLSEWNHAKRKQLAIEIVLSGILDRIPLENIPFNSTPEFFEKLRKGAVENILSNIQYSK